MIGRRYRRLMQASKLDCEPELWPRRRLGANPSIGALRDGDDIRIEIVEHEVADVHAHDEYEVMCAPTGPDFREQQGPHRPSPAQELMTLGHRIIVAISGVRMHQPAFRQHSTIIGLRNDSSIDVAVHGLQLCPQRLAEIVLGAAR